MAQIGSYKNMQFSENQKFLVLDPATGTTSLVLGSSLVDYITPNLGYVYAETTRVAAENTDYAVGSIIQTSGSTSIGDNFAATYLVVGAGEGDFPMINGNELLTIKGDEFLREQLASEDAGEGASLVSMEGGPTVEEAVNNRVIRVSSRTEMKAYDVPAGYQFSLEEGGRSGLFVRRSGTPPVSDPDEGLYVVADAGGYDERINVVQLQSGWFGSLVNALDYARGSSFEIVATESDVLDEDVGTTDLRDATVIIPPGVTVTVTFDLSTIYFGLDIRAGGSLDENGFTVSYPRRVVQVPEDYGTITEAIINEKKKAKLGRNIVVFVADTYEIPERIYFQDEDLSMFEILSETAPLSGGVIDVSGSYSDDGVFVFVRCKAPVLNLLVDGKGITGATESGVRYNENTTGIIKDGAGVKNAQWRGLYVTGGSSVAAQNSVWDGAGAEGIRGSNMSVLHVRGASCTGSATGLSASASYVECKDSDFSGCTSTALIVTGASVVDADNVNASGAGTDCLFAEDGSVVSITNSDLSNCSNHAINAETGATVDAENVNTEGCNGSYAILARGASVFANNSTISTTTNPVANNAIGAFYGGKVSVDTCTIEDAGGVTLRSEAGEITATRSSLTNDGTSDDIVVTSGAIVRAGASTYSTASIAVNTLTADGIIFD